MDFAAWETTALTSAPDLKGAPRPAIRRGEDGTVWSCGALGAGTVLEIGAMREESPSALRDRLVEIAMGQL